MSEDRKAKSSFEKMMELIQPYLPPKIKFKKKIYSEWGLDNTSIEYGKEDTKT